MKNELIKTSKKLDKLCDEIWGLVCEHDIDECDWEHDFYAYIDYGIGGSWDDLLKVVNAASTKHKPIYNVVGEDHDEVRLYIGTEAEVEERLRGVLEWVKAEVEELVAEDAENDKIYNANRAKMIEANIKSLTKELKQLNKASTS